MSIPPPTTRPRPVRAALEAPAEYGLRQWSGLVLGPALLAVTLFLPAPMAMPPAAWTTAGLALLMAVFWMSEAIPIPATALLPLVLLPVLGLADGAAAAAPYASPIVYLFLAGFLLALAMQRWGLHRRIAIGLIGALGLQPTRLVGGFLLAAAFISMWVSNTATALLMLPIGTSVLALIPEEHRQLPATRQLSVALMLAVAYGATTGGMGTLIGTPPNALLAAYMERTYDVTIGFGQWMLLGVPVVLLGLPAVWLVLTRICFRLDSAELPGVGALLASERARLGRLRGGEALVAVVFTLTAIGWIFQPWLAQRWPEISDTTIGMSGALLLFLLPVSRTRGEFVMNWQTAKAVPWDVLLLFGGGLSLAQQIQRSGLASFLGESVAQLHALPVWLLIGILCFGVLLLTELTSNTATAATFLPVVGAVAVSLGHNPLFFLIPTALAANCSYMMPVGTPPNAIVFGSGHVTLPDMVRAGWWLNVILVPIILGVLWLLGPWVFGLEAGVLPAWAQPAAPVTP